jgi:predicted Rossmann-fold nucleotide-binding protein
MVYKPSNREVFLIFSHFLPFKGVGGWGLLECQNWRVYLNMPKLKEELSKEHFRVAIFGSARIGKDDPNYKLIFNLARLIASKGIDVVTGGGPGLMDAASSGHFKGRRDDSQHSIGLNIRLPHEQTNAAHLDIKKDFYNFSTRLDHFMVLSDVAVIAPGGVGTLLEFFYTWQLVQVEHICNIPIILLGEMWFDLVRWIRT